MGSAWVFALWEDAGLQLGKCSAWRAWEPPEGCSSNHGKAMQDSSKFDPLPSLLPSFYDLGFCFPGTILVVQSSASPGLYARFWEVSSSCWLRGLGEVAALSPLPPP